MKELLPIEVEIHRGEFVESLHHVHGALVNESGELIKAWGSYQRAVSPRSAIKKLQAIAFVESGAVEQYNLDSRHIALACSSHVGEPAHLSLVREWRERMGLRVDDFVCGAHYPFDESSAHNLIRQSLKPTSEHNNCSGKHLGILSTCLLKSWAIQNYGNYDHPAQIHLRDLLSELMDFDVHASDWGVDGCGIPTNAIPLYKIARGMSQLLSSKAHAKASKLILDSVAQSPFYIAGTEEFATRLAQVTQGRVIVKIGAEGVYCGVDRDKKWAFALKCEDGTERGVSVALCGLLENEKLVSEAEKSQLETFFSRKLRNWKGLEVGSIRARKETL